MLTDEELMLRIQQGDRAALALLVSRYHAQVRNYLWRMSGNQMMADDLCQDCFVRMLERAYQYTFPRPFKPWLYRIATNLCRDMWRSHAWQDSRSNLPQELEGQTNVEHMLDRQLDRQLVINALAALDSQSREIVILRYYNDLKLEDIALVVELPVNTVKTRLYRALKQLKPMLEEVRDGEKQIREN